MKSVFIVIGVLIWFWMGYFVWRKNTKYEEYYNLSHFLLLFLFLVAAPIAFYIIICILLMNSDVWKKPICKRWLSKKEKIEKVKKRLNERK